MSKEAKEFLKREDVPNIIEGWELGKMEVHILAELMQTYADEVKKILSDDYISKVSLEILTLVESQEYKEKEYVHEMHKMIIKSLKQIEK